VITALAAVGWALAAALGWRTLAFRGRLHSVADAEHELRGSITAFALVLERPRGATAADSVARALESELARARAGLEVLAAARVGRRPNGAPGGPAIPLERLTRSAARAWEPAARRAGRRLDVDWLAGAAISRADRGRLSQALGNVISNAVEHGAGPVRLIARRDGGAVRIEVGNAVTGGPPTARPGRGRGMAIAARAVSEAGGTLSFTRAGERVEAALVVPVEP